MMIHGGVLSFQPATSQLGAGAIPADEAMMGAAIAAWSGAHLWEAGENEYF